MAGATMAIEFHWYPTESRGRREAGTPPAPALWDETRECPLLSVLQAAPRRHCGVGVNAVIHPAGRSEAWAAASAAQGGGWRGAPLQLY